MAEEFVKKEVFDAHMDRMEALLEKTLAVIGPSAALAFFPFFAVKYPMQ